jgi:hypothetical protein
VQALAALAAVHAVVLAEELTVVIAQLTSPLVLCHQALAAGEAVMINISLYYVKNNNNNNCIKISPYHQQ